MYELVAVARTQQAAGPPVFTELGPIVAPTITWIRALRGAGTVNFSCIPDRLEQSVLDRLADPATTPLEVWLNRDGALVAAGLVSGCQVQGGTLTVTAPGLLAYLQYMMVDADLFYPGTDQTLIGKGLVDQWQALPYGDYGIDTSGITASGVTRDRTYLAAENHNVAQRLTDLSQAADGFDIDLDPATRELLLIHPQQGSDLSGSIIFDDRNITDASVVMAAGPGDIASEAFGLGGGSSDAAAATSRKVNTSMRAAWGRAAVAGSFDGVTQQTTLDQHTQALLDARADVLFLPGAGLVPTAEVPIGSFDIGDTVTYDYDAGLGRQTGAFRVAELVTSVDEGGRESMAVRFA